MPSVQLTCGIPKEGASVRLCGDDAVFRYIGPVQVRSGETYVHALQRRGRTVVDLCMDHTRLFFVGMEPALKDGIAVMRCLVQTKLTLHCQSCQSLFRFEPLRPNVVRTAAQPSQHDGYYLIPNHFCPNCGSAAIAQFDPSLDYWELLSAKLDLPTYLTPKLFSLYQADKTATAKFVDYIQQILSELDG